MRVAARVGMALSGSVGGAGSIKSSMPGDHAGSQRRMNLPWFLPKNEPGMCEYVALLC
jgi:hypothetical protein